MLGQGKVIAKRAPDFTLADETGEPTSLSDLLKNGPLVLAFYPSDFTSVCTSQWCNYRDAAAEFDSIPIQVVGISKNMPDSHARFRAEHNIPFKLLSDPKKQVAQVFGCSSLLMLGMTSRAVFIINKVGMILYQYVEPTALTRRKSDELLSVLRDLKNQRLI